MSVSNNINAAQAVTKLRAAVQQATYRAAASIQTLAVSRTPIEQGDLRGSTTLRMIDEASAARTEIAYNMIYSSRQHEETGWNHPRGGQAKYLESAMQDGQDEAKAIIRNHLKGILNG